MRCLALLLALAACDGSSALRAWLTRWEAARVCAVGTPARGPDTATAVTIATLKYGPKHCEEHRDRLRAGAPPALAEEVSLLDLTDGAAIDRVEAKIRDLARRADLSLEPRPPTAVVPELPAGKELIVKGMTTLDLRGHGRGRLVFEASNPTTTAHVEVSSLEGIRSWSFPRGYRIAHPSHGWAAQARDRTLSTLEVDRPSQLVQTDLAADYVVAAALDAGTARAVVLQAIPHGRFAIALSSDAGRSWRIIPSPSDIPLTQTIQDASTGTTYLVTEPRSSTHMHRLDRLEPWAFPESVVIPIADEALRCHADGFSWAVVEESESRRVRVVSRVGFPTSETFVNSFKEVPAIVDCRKDSALLAVQSPEMSELVAGEITDSLHLCRSRCDRVYTARHPRRGVAALLDDGTWIYAQGMKGVVAVWHQRFTTRFYRSADADRLVGIISLDGAPHLLLRPSDDVLRIVPLPRENYQTSR